MRTLLLVLLVLGALLTPGLAAAGPPSLATLAPGAALPIDQELTVNVVFVGYAPGGGPQQIDTARLLSGLPANASLVSRFPRLLGQPADLGLSFQYDYRLTFAPTLFADAFFGYLGSIAQPQPRTFYQEQYNLQAARSLNVTQNHSIDAPSVERWLADHTQAMLGVDTSRYTVFLVNWYGRPDFKFHVYSKTNEPDPDTGFSFGALDSRKLMAWGGTTPDDEENGLGSLHRIWFYDLSAGPDGWTDSWNLDDADLDGFGADYRIPPIWEYGNLAAYRPFDDLAGDLAKVLRYVALNQLFTPSPIYRPSINAPLQPAQIQLDLTVYQGEPGVDGTQFVDLALIEDEVGELQPTSNISVELNDTPLDGRAGQVFDCFSTGAGCYGGRGGGGVGGDLSLFHGDQLNRYLEGDGDYEIPGFGYNTTMLFNGGLGFADNDFSDGTQNFIYGFTSSDIRSFGYGLSTTFIHEAGHHLGLAHPTDGYDPATGQEYGPFDSMRFAAVGDQQNSMMGYIDLNWDFSQFDRDSMARYLTSAYLNQANAILAAIYATPRAGDVAALLSAADASAAQALAAYQAMQYADATLHAKAAHQALRSAAEQLHIPLAPAARRAEYRAHGLDFRFGTLENAQRLKR